MPWGDGLLCRLMPLGFLFPASTKDRSWADGLPDIAVLGFGQDDRHTSGGVWFHRNAPGDVAELVLPLCPGNGCCPWMLIHPALTGEADEPKRSAPSLSCHSRTPWPESYPLTYRKGLTTLDQPPGPVEFNARMRNSRPSVCSPPSSPSLLLPLGFTISLPGGRLVRPLLYFRLAVLFLASSAHAKAGRTSQWRCRRSSCRRLGCSHGAVLPVLRVVPNGRP